MEITQTFPEVHVVQIRVSDTRHKFDSALAEYVHDIRMDDWASESRGDAESPIGWFAPIGAKRILRGDSRGFVYVEKFDDTAGRDAIVTALELFDMVWSDPADDVEMFEEEHDREIEKASAYVAYCYACESYACLPLAFSSWEKYEPLPTGPLG